jgi:hypothetical protein
VQHTIDSADLFGVLLPRGTHCLSLRSISCILYPYSVVSSTYCVNRIEILKYVVDGEGVKVLLKISSFRGELRPFFFFLSSILTKSYNVNLTTQRHARLVLWTLIYLSYSGLTNDHGVMDACLLHLLISAYLRVDTTCILWFRWRRRQFIQQQTLSYN